MAGDPIAGTGFCAEEFHDLIAEIGGGFSVPETSLPEIPTVPQKNPDQFDNPLDHYSEVEQKCLIDAPKPGFRPVAICREPTLDMSFDPRYRENHPCALKQRLSKDKDQQEQGQLYVRYVVKELKDPSIVAIALKGEVEGLSEAEQRQLQIIILSDLQLIDIKGSVTEQVVFEFIQETSDPEMKQLAVAAILKVDVPPSPAQEKCFVSPDAIIAEVAQAGPTSLPIVLGVAQTDDGLGNFQDTSALVLYSAAMGTLPEREAMSTRTTGVAGPADNRGVDSTIMIGAAGGISDTASMPPKSVVIEFNPAQKPALVNAALGFLESDPLILASSSTVEPLTQFLTTLQGVDPQLQATIAKAMVGLLQTEGALAQNPQDEGTGLQLVISWGEVRTVISDGVHVPTKTDIEISLVKHQASGVLWQGRSLAGVNNPELGNLDGTHVSESLPDRVIAGNRHSTLGGRRSAVLPGLGIFTKDRSREEEIGNEVVFIGVPIQQLIRLTEKMEDLRVSQFAKDSTSHQRGATEVARDGDTADRHGRGSSDQSPSDRDQDDEYAFYDDEDEDFEDSDGDSDNVDIAAPNV